MPKADFITGLVLMVVAAFLVGEGLRLPGAGGLIMKGGEPGRVPIFLGLCIAAMAVVLIVRAVSQNGHRLGGLSLASLDSERKQALVRALAVAAGGTLYVALLARNFSGAGLDYAIFTFLFMLVFIVIADWHRAPGIAGKRWQTLERRAPAAAARLAGGLPFVSAARAPYVWLIVTATVQSALLALAIAYVFEKQFFVTLP